MRFSTKILLLTLTITIGLSGIVVLVVRRQLTQRETHRADSAIAAAAQKYFHQLDAEQAKVRGIVELLWEDPNNRALLDNFTTGAKPDENAQNQIGKYLFAEVLQKKLNSPAFHVLVNATSQTAVAEAGDAILQAALQSQKIAWHIDDVLHKNLSLRQYLWLNDKLYLVLAVPIQQTSGEEPTFAYFCGFEINDEWLGKLLAADQPGEVAIAAWFIVDGRIVAGGADQRSGLPIEGPRVAELIQNAPPSQHPTSTTLPLDGDVLAAQYMSFEPAPNVRGTLVLASSRNEALAPLWRLQRQIAFVTACVVVLALIAARWLSRTLAKPVEQLVAAAQRIARGNFHSPITIHRRDELGELAHSFNEMSLGLAQRDLIKDTLGQFVDPRIADALLVNPASLRGQRVVQSVLFSDLEKFATLSEKLSPEELVKVLNKFLGASADVVKELKGYLDKFIGDGVVAFWGPPVETNHAVAACRAALRMVELTRQFQDPPLRVRLGIATGEVIVGIVGSESSKKNYTAMGDVVNLASRLEGANKIYGTQILVDATTARQVNSEIVTRKIDVVRVIGRTEPVELHEVLAASDAARVQQYDAAMQLYSSRHWSEAKKAFSTLNDSPARAMAMRCERFMQVVPEVTWDGVWNLDAK